MRILIFHGYLLRGTGSNVYNASLAQALARLGHEVDLLCQDRDAAQLDWVNAVGSWGPGGLTVERLREPGGAGSVTVYTPDTGGLLPVYVADRYEGFRVKTFPELSDAELEDYLAANVSAVREVIASAGEPDAALANHLIMGPVILARAGLRFATKVHGSDLSYTVRPHPERFVPFAREGMEATAGALVGSRHTAEDLWKTVGLPGLEQRTRLGPPGVDVDAFRQLPPAEADARALRLADALEGTAGGGGGGDAFARDTGDAAEAVRWFVASEGPRVMYVGKLLVNKGVDLLLAGWPLVVRENPGARLLIIGFGGYGSALERLWSALEAGDLAAAAEVAAAGRALEGEGEPAEPLPILSGFLEQPPEGYAEAGRAAAGSVAFGGRLEHEEVAELMPSADAFVMPSTFPEAFGMVAAEAAACGALPISAGHSGMAEVSSRLAPVVPEVAELISFPVNERAVTEISSRLNRYLALAPAQRREIGAALAQRVSELWSWQSVAAAVIAASEGELDSIPEVIAKGA